MYVVYPDTLIIPALCKSKRKHVTLGKKGGVFMSTMIIVAIISIIVVLIVLALSVLTINKGYSYKHKIDPPKNTASDEARENK